MDYTIRRKSAYKGKTENQYHTVIGFCTKKQMKTIYPNKNYRVIGEINNKAGVQCGTAENIDGNPLPVYKENTHNKLTERIIGYTAVDDHTYLAVIQNVMMKRILILCLIILPSAGVIYGIFRYLFG